MIINNQLINSAGKGDLPAVKAALEAGADIHALNDVALRWAASNGNISMVKYLVQQGANIHALNDYALRCAVQKGYHEVIRYLKLAAKFQAVKL